MTIPTVQRGRDFVEDRTRHFRSSEDLEQTLHRYVTLYNHHLPQKALDAGSSMARLVRFKTRAVSSKAT